MDSYGLVITFYKCTTSLFIISVYLNSEGQISSARRVGADNTKVLVMIISFCDTVEARTTINLE